MLTHCHNQDKCVQVHVCMLTLVLLLVALLCGKQAGCGLSRLKLQNGKWHKVHQVMVYSITNVLRLVLYLFKI